MAQTSFFRDKDVLDLIVTHVIPVVSTFRDIRIWDAGCASGEEPYSLAMLFAEKLNPFSFRSVYIDATDREESNFPQFERIIQSGQYDKSSVMWVPEDLRAKYFSPLAGSDCFEIIPELKSRITFTRHDLTSLQMLREDYCLIVCKNTLMHITPESQSEIVPMFHRSLRDPGFLALDIFQKLPPGTEHLFQKVTETGNLFKKI